MSHFLSLYHIIRAIIWDFSAIMIFTVYGLVKLKALIVNYSYQNRKVIRHMRIIKFCLRSMPMEVLGPCPGSTMVLSGSFMSTFLMLFIMSFILPVARSVLPQLSAKSVSPEKSTGALST